MQVRVEEREGAAGQVCPLCRAALAGAVWNCERCAATLHAECARELPRCPTLGCAGRPPEDARAPDRGPALPRRPFVPPGEVVATVAPPERAATVLLRLGLALAGALLLLSGLVAAGVALWRARPRPAPPPSPVFQRETVVVGEAALRGDPPRAVRLEKAYYLELRVDGQTRPLPWLTHYDWRGVVPLPGHAVDLLHFGAGSGTFAYDVFLGFTRDGRLVAVRKTYGGPDRQEASPPRPTDAEDPQRGPPAPPARAPAEWVTLLRGDDPVAALDALAWLALPGGSTQNVFVPAEAVAVLEQARAAPEVRAAVEALRAAASPWTREAAEHAAARLP